MKPLFHSTKVILDGILSLSVNLEFAATMKFSWDQKSVSTPRLVLTSDDPSSDQITTQHWKDEGFQVTYLPFTGSRKQYERDIHRLPEPLELGEKYAIVGWFLRLCPRPSNDTEANVCVPDE